jgi:hypothetical protein
MTGLQVVILPPLLVAGVANWRALRLSQRLHPQFQQSTSRCLDGLWRNVTTTLTFRLTQQTSSGAFTLRQRGRRNALAET